MVSFYSNRKSVKFKVKCAILEKSKTDSIDMNYLAMLSKNALIENELNKKNTNKNIVLPQQMLDIHPNHTVTKVILRRAHNKTFPYSKSRLSFKVC